MDNAAPDPDDLPLSDAVDRWIRKRESNSTERTIRGYENRLNQFVKWCDENDITTVSELNAWVLDEYQLALADEGLAPTTIKSRLSTLRLFVDYLAVLELIPEELPDAIDVPNLSRQEERNEERLDPEIARQALTYFRDRRAHYGTPMHAFLELAWHTGARMGSIRGLDLSDFDRDRQAVRFQHRPSTDTPLKNKNSGERWVGLSDPVCEVLRFYTARERYDRRDDHGREPLFATRQGRASYTTLRAWSYQATQPCLWMECPHGRRPDTCEWTKRAKRSKCPSSRSPHMIRTGSITWQLNQGYPIEWVAERVNASISVIKHHYDQATLEEEFERRRQYDETSLDIATTENDNNE